MKERPILFSSEMVRAILDGRKTQTRRVVNWRSDRADEVHDGEGQGNSLFEMRDGGWWPYYAYDGMEIPLECPYSADRLWVRETFCPDIDGKPHYRATSTDWCANPEFTKWRPSIHMPRKYCRLLLNVKAIRVERLNDISEDDCKAEGCVDRGDSAGDEFAELWESINGKRGYGWKENPWVWVIEFERIQTRREPK